MSSSFDKGNWINPEAPGKVFSYLFLSCLYSYLFIAPFRDLFTSNSLQAEHFTGAGIVPVY